MIYQKTPRVQLHNFEDIKALVKDIDDCFVSEVYQNPDNKDSVWGTLNIIAKTEVIKQVYSLITKKNNLVSVNGKYTIFDEDTNEKVSEIFDKYDVLHIAINDDGEVFIETLDYYDLFSDKIDGCVNEYAYIQQGIDVGYMAQAEKYNIPVLWFDV